ncbi:MAG: ABC transporter permease [Spirochaetaceae bacterium]|jgi:lipoprotein-releasing system permease protein|nr:ABC transporter permease [Spirochaetaceae bacterium]
MKKNIFGNIRWTAFVAWRYVSKKGQRSRSQMALSILGIAIGVLSLTVILSVMNGFQLGFIESIIEISSYHLRVSNFPKEDEALISQIQRLNGVKTAALFFETKGLLKGTGGGGAVFSSDESRQSAVLIRGLRPSTLTVDKGMAEHLEFERGGFNIERRGSILLGSELASSLGLRLGDECEFISLSNILPGDNEMRQARFTVRGIFRTGFFEYDLSWAFINLEDALELENGAAHEASAGTAPTLGIKLKHREQDRQFALQVETLLRDSIGGAVQQENIHVNSWRDYNKAFFNALRTEKLMMFVLVGLIFIITAMNIYHSQRRMALERSEEIALLRAVGATPAAARSVFALSGCILGALGSTLGMIPALLIVTHIRGFFSAIEAVINAILGALSFISGGIIGGEYSIFSVDAFYLKEIPARAIPQEIVIIYLCGFLSAAISAFIASSRVSRIRPAEALRYE